MFFLTNFFILLNHLALLVESPEPPNLLLQFLGHEDVELLRVLAAQFEGVLHAHDEVVVAPVDGVHHLVAVHVDAPLVVEDVPPYQILGDIQIQTITEKRFEGNIFDEHKTREKTNEAIRAFVSICVHEVIVP